MTPDQFSEMARVIHEHGIETGPGVHVMFIQNNPVTLRYTPFNAFLVAGLGVCIHAHLDAEGEIVNLVTDKDDDAFWSEVHMSIMACAIAILESQ